MLVKELKLTCENMGNCRAFGRHYQRIYQKNEGNWTTEDRAFRTECDKMHIFFFQFSNNSLRHKYVK